MVSYLREKLYVPHALRLEELGKKTVTPILVNGQSLSERFFNNWEARPTLIGLLDASITYIKEYHKYKDEPYRKAVASLMIGLGYVASEIMIQGSNKINTEKYGLISRVFSSTLMAIAGISLLNLSDAQTVHPYEKESYVDIRDEKNNIIGSLPYSRHVSMVLEAEANAARVERKQMQEKRKQEREKRRKQAMEEGWGDDFI